MYLRSRTYVMPRTLAQLMRRFRPNVLSKCKVCTPGGFACARCSSVVAWFFRNCYAAVTGSYVLLSCFLSLASPSFAFLSARHRKTAASGAAPAMQSRFANPTLVPGFVPGLGRVSREIKQALGHRAVDLGQARCPPLLVTVE